MKFRPEDDPHPDSPVEWVDNPVSNTFAWASYKFIPSWCKTETHFSSRITQYLWTDCACCLLWRGFTVAGVIGVLFGLALGMVTCWLIH